MTSGPHSTLVLQAPAKVNLFLKVLGKRADGFHEIETVMQSLSLHDTLRVQTTASPDLVLEIEHVHSRRLHPSRPVTPIPVDERNLVIKAALALRAYTGCQLGATFLLRKRIPAEAGLGGGSSDAAATLLALNRLWQLELTQTELQQMAGQLGSDVPFFLQGWPLAVATGRGEQLQTARGCPLSIVIVKPHSGLSTAKVYANCEVSSFPHSSKELLNALQNGELTRIESVVTNSLEQPAVNLNPDVRSLLDLMQAESFLASMMSGSGTSCFGLCRHPHQAQRIASRLKSRNIGQVYVTRCRL